MLYISTIQKLATSLKTIYENTIFTNPTNIGDTREKEVIEYLTKVMPGKYGFLSGEVFDDGEKTSGQVDVIIYDNLFSSVFTDGSNKILAPIESTYGVISVKSKMGVKELDDAISGIKKYDALNRPKSEKGVAYIMPDLRLVAEKNLYLSGTIQQNFNCIFAFDATTSANNIKQKIADAGCVDLLVVPGKFCVLGRSREVLKVNKDGSPLSSCVIETDDAIAIFILLLQIYLSSNRLIGKDIQKLAATLIGQGKLHI